MKKRVLMCISHCVICSDVQLLCLLRRLCVLFLQLLQQFAEKGQESINSCFQEHIHCETNTFWLLAFITAVGILTF